MAAPKIKIKGFVKHSDKAEITKKDISDLRKDESGKKYKNKPKIVKKK